MRFGWRGAGYFGAGLLLGVLGMGLLFGPQLDPATTARLLQEPDETASAATHAAGAGPAVAAASAPAAAPAPFVPVDAMPTSATTESYAAAKEAVANLPIAGQVASVRERAPRRVVTREEGLPPAERETLPPPERETIAQPPVEAMARPPVERESVARPLAEREAAARPFVERDATARPAPALRQAQNDDTPTAATGSATGSATATDPGGGEPLQ